MSTEIRQPSDKMYLAMITSINSICIQDNEFQKEWHRSNFGKANNLNNSDLTEQFMPNILNFNNGC